VNHAEGRTITPHTPNWSNLSRSIALNAGYLEAVYVRIMTMTTELEEKEHLLAYPRFIATDLSVQDLVIRFISALQRRKSGENSLRLTAGSDRKHQRATIKQSQHYPFSMR
jgi:hypothetical protein